MRSGAPAAHHGPEAFKQFLVSVHAGLSDLEIFNEDEIAEGDQVVVRWKMQGTHIGELSGIPPTGKHVKWTGITIYRIINGKVVEEKGEEDALGVLQQLGVVPSMS